MRGAGGWLHERWRRRVSLLALGALEPAERAAALAHLERCPACREELAALRDVLALVDADPVHDAAPPLSAAALAARVRRRLDVSRPSAAARGAMLRPLAAAAAVVLAVWALPAAGPRRPPAAAARPAEVTDETLERLEAHVAREQAVRYLNAAQDVLVTVSVARRDCERKGGRVDVAGEARRSRELLERRPLLELNHARVASARPVLDDVELVLRDVASLEACARARDLAAIQRLLQQRRLLMKIDLMTRELQG